MPDFFVSKRKSSLLAQFSSAMTMEEEEEERCGLVVANSDSIRSFLLSAAEDRDHLSLSLCDLASHLASQRSLPYKPLRTLWSSLPPAARPALRSLFAGSDFVFHKPKPREKSKELKERLRKLQEMAERKAYEELVRDVAPRKEPAEPFSSYKDQIGFGLHVVLIMFTGYLVGHAAFRALFNHSAVMNAAGGILGLVCGMLLETVLFIIKTSSQDIISTRATSRLKKNQ